MQMPLLTPRHVKCFLPSSSATLPESAARGRRVTGVVKNSGRTDTATAPLLCHESAKVGQPSAGLVHVPHALQVRELEAELRRLKAENARLQQVEEQFWVLLAENEELQKAETHSRAPVEASYGCGRRHGGSFLGGCRKEQNDEESWRISSCVRALRECMDLLFARELNDASQADCTEAVKKQLEQEDSVATYLLWLRARRGRGVDEHKPNDILLPHREQSAIVGGGEAAPRNKTSVRDGVSLAIPPFQQELNETNTVLLRRSLEDTERQLQETREMLELANMSRSAALKDCTRMSEQVTTLTDYLQEILRSYKTSHDLWLENEALNAFVEKQARDIKVRDKLLAEMRVTLQQLKNTRSSEEVSLTETTERVRRQLLERQAISTSVSIGQ
ncbi:hypothetical protein TraAM80_06169 [Trypanosoma rangeli]|uniref:Uncharacterized protein n=1 Tax=Trypanosoma rangeli TaxID=5698 RepID=A0A422NB65_TRYRA|nr:uncharacterized protein TraAM80_06169 [Trypanosoma rangeli]RNF02718.1 hypothetical protein TraAM80_06169 [Trypanosoma rangeli]|eukprot:RNF02718.1 hypothetical protein TraAM80_06169 [Trypanosoma rangeli]